MPPLHLCAFTAQRGKTLHSLHTILTLEKEVPLNSPFYRSQKLLHFLPSILPCVFLHLGSYCLHILSAPLFMELMCRFRCKKLCWVQRSMADLISQLCLKCWETKTIHNQWDTTYILDKFQKKNQLLVLATVNSHQQVARFRPQADGIYCTFFFFVFTYPEHTLFSTNQTSFYFDTENKMELNHLKIKRICFYLILISFCMWEVWKWQRLGEFERVLSLCC